MHIKDLIILQNEKHFQSFQEGYIRALLRSYTEVTYDSSMRDPVYKDLTFDPTMLIAIERDCKSFFAKAEPMIRSYVFIAGHDFCMTRNNYVDGFQHHAGIWASDMQKLYKLASSFPSQRLLWNGKFLEMVSGK